MPEPTPTWIPEGYSSSVVDFDDGEQRRATLGKSIRLWWEQAIPCPCSEIRTTHGRANDSGEPQGDCVACHGAGTMYVNGQQITAMRTSAQDKFNLYSEYGTYAKGTVFFTFFPENIGDHLDRYTLLDGAMVYSERRMRKETPTRLRYPVIHREIITGTLGDETAPRQITVGIIYCRAAAATGEVTLNELVEDVDFTLTDNGRVIDWSLGDALGTAPAIGARFSVRYWGRPRFVLDDHVYLSRDLYTRNTDGALCYTPMPVRALAILDFLGGNPPNSEDNPQPTSDMR